MFNSNKKCVRQSFKSLRNARYLYAFTACWLGAGLSMLLLPHALAEERKRPLEVQIPSIPTGIPSVDVVDNNLPVHLLDAQVDSVRHAQPPPQGPPSATTVSSGQLVIGNAPAASSDKRRNIYPSRQSPAVVVAGEKRAITPQSFSPPASLATSSSLSPSAKPTVQQLSDPTAVAIPVHTSTRKKFLNHFALERPRYLAPEQMTRMPVAYASQASAPVLQPVMARPTRLTAVMPETPVTQQPQPMVAENKLERVSSSLADSSSDLEESLAMLEQPQDITALPTMAEAKQAFAPDTSTHIGEATIASSLISASSRVLSPVVNAQPLLPAADPVITDVPPQAATPPQIIYEQPQKQIAALPSLEQAKQAFNNAPPPTAVEVARQEVMGNVVAAVSDDAQSLAILEPAAGNPQAAMVDKAPVRSGLVLEEVGAEETTGASNYHPVDLTSVLPQKREDLSEESRRMLKRVPSKIDTPNRKARQERVDIEREKITASVFSEIDGEAQEQEAPPLDVTIDIKRSVLDVNYELERAYNAIASGQNEIARESYRRVLSVEPNNIQALFGMGALLHRAGDLNGARLYYAKVLKQNPDHRDTLNNFLSLVAEESPEQALTKLKELEMKNPDFSPIPAQIAYIYQKLQNLPLAAQYMVKALALAPNNLTYKYNLAILLDKQGARTDAAQFYQDLVDAYLKGENIPGNIASIQERLTFIRSNR